MRELHSFLSECFIHGLLTGSILIIHMVEHSDRLLSRGLIRDTCICGHNLLLHIRIAIHFGVQHPEKHMSRNHLQVVNKETLVLTLEISFYIF